MAATCLSLGRESARLKGFFEIRRQALPATPESCEAIEMQTKVHRVGIRLGLSPIA